MIEPINQKELKIIEKKVIERELKIREARDSFWCFCKLYGYKNHWIYLKEICNTLQAFFENKPLKDGKVYNKLMINLPPRHYKTRTLILFCAWMLGKDNTTTIISTSYSDDLATEFSRYTRDEISKQKNFELDICFSDIFENTRIQEGNASYSKWSLEGQFFNYLGAGFMSSITGKGCKIGIVDDAIKSYEEACNEDQLIKKWDWYKNTFLSRQEENAKQIICMTRWSEKDICGMLLNDKDESKGWYVIVKEAYDKKTDKMLNPDLLSKESYMSKKRLMDDDIFMANYHQITVEKKGRLYQQFKEYSELPTDERGFKLENRRFACIDTADQGNDFLCAITGVEYAKDFYITDILCTKEPQEITERKTCELLIKNNTKEVLIESNAGGRTFARNIESMLHTKYKRYDIQINWFTQTQNKISRILTNASNVENRLFYPKNWAFKFPEYAKQIKGFMRDKKNKNDDAPDTATMVIENIDGKMRREIRIPNFSAGSLGL